jgi:hypothetical protein
MELYFHSPVRLFNFTLARTFNFEEEHDLFVNMDIRILYKFIMLSCELDDRGIASW